ncbi:MAG: DUF4303 domain-containing protein [bacterium]|nr:DUF4303 domain-containing protein [bacterium]
MKDNSKRDVSGVTHDRFRASVEQLCEVIDASGRAEELSGIGFVTTDDLLAIVASLRFDGDLPTDAEPYQLLSPVEWPRSEERSFDEFNQHLELTRPPVSESDAEYERRVRDMFELCASVVEQLDLRNRYGASLFLAFAGVDPNSVLEVEEKRFVARLNPSKVFKEWCDEFD